MVHNFPADHKTEAGQPFWTSLKRLPKPITFDPDDPTHVHFLIAAANLWAYVFNVAPLQDKRAAAIIAAELKTNTFQPKNVVIKESEQDTREEKAEDDEVRVKELLDILSGKVFTDT